MFEETKRGTLKELSAYFSEKGVKGEIVVCIGGKPEKASSSKQEEE
jgi:16S rRNA (cytidine1402-2'-O)-methyltransferase